MQYSHTIETNRAAIRATLSGARKSITHCAKSIETFGAAAGGPDSRQDKILALVDHALRAAETIGQKGAYLHLHAPGEFRYTVAATDKKRLNALRKDLAAATRKRAPRAGGTNGSGRLHYDALQNARTVDSQIVDLLSGDCGEPRRQREANALAALLAHYDKVPADKRKMTVVWVQYKDQTVVPFFRVEGKTWAADDFGFCVGVTLGDGISGSLWCVMAPAVPNHIANCSRSAPAVRKALEEGATRSLGWRTHDELVESVRARYATDEKGRNAREVQTLLTLQAVDQYPDIPLEDLAELAEFTSLEECETAAFEAMMDAGDDE